MTRLRLKLGLLFAAALALGGYAALAQVAPGMVATSLISTLFLPVINAGPQNAYVAVHGTTFTCTNGGVITVTNANVTANSQVLITLKTVGGTPAVPIPTTITAGTGLTVTCGGSDSSVYNLSILG